MMRAARGTSSYAAAAAALIYFFLCEKHGVILHNYMLSLLLAESDEMSHGRTEG